MQGPSIEWRLQPLPSQAADLLADEVAGVMELEVDAGEEVRQVTGYGVSFAAIARMGFAAAVDSPSLSELQPPRPQGAWGGGGKAFASPQPGGSSSSPSPRRVWGSASSPAGAWGQPDGASGAGPSGEAGQQQQGGSSSSRGKKGGKKSTLLFSSGGQRRY